MPKRQITGKIVSNKMQKTVVVRAERIKEHPKYRKRYKINTNYKAEANEKDYQIGDLVLIEECTPISKDKKWKVVKKISAVATEGEQEEAPDFTKEEVKEEAEK